MPKIRCGIIGLGWFGKIHVDTLKSLPLAEVIAVSTRREWRLTEIAERYGIPKTYPDYRDMLADKDIDMVTIVTAVKDHFRPTIDALRAGKHVFLEKPMAYTAGECDGIIEEAEKSEKCFMVGHICRFDTAYALAKQEIASGNLGRIVSIYARRNLNKSLVEAVLENSSALFGDGVHDLDLALWYTGAKPVSVYAQTMNTRPNHPYDDMGWALFRLDSGAIVVIETLWCLPENAPFAMDARMEVIGTGGAIYIDNSGANYTLMTKKGLTYPEAAYWPRVHDARRGHLKEEFEYFLGCIAHGEKPEVISPKEARDVVAAVKLAEVSARENRVVEF